MAFIDEDVERSCETPVFPLARFRIFRGYYPFGNIAAEDLLENCADTSHPSVLMLGCGDLRSCLYTIWKHFDASISSAPQKFDGVCFTLNDCSAAVLARNIIFLYLCLQLPSDSEDKKKWLCAMWAIWYCHKLYPNHLDILDSALKTLVTFSESKERWHREDNPLHHFVHFTSSASLSEIAEVWEMWLNKAVNTSLKKMHKTRSKYLSSEINDESQHSLNLSKGHTLIYGEQSHITQEKGKARAPEVQSYIEVGSCFAEGVINLNLPATIKTVNLTMYNNRDGEYICHYGLMPFECFHQTFEFSPQYLKSKGVALPYDVFVPSASFNSEPFLANSFQQFVMWIQSSSRVLKEAKFKVSFVFNCQDAITFCQQKTQQTSEECYDIITTSNLTDHISPANLVLACLPLLKSNGLLATTTMCCKNCANTGEEFMSLCFGFSSQLFPVILGVRCISHEGSDCSNSVMINPSPPDISHTMKCLPHVRTLVWMKTSPAQKLVLAKLPCVENGNVTEALVNMIGSCSYALLSYGPGQGESSGVLSRNGIETALGMLDRFISLSSESTADHSYWQPLCAALGQAVPPFLHCLQTQALLHSIHIHLTIDEKNCPVCLKKPLLSYLGCFCANVSSELLSLGAPFFVAFLHLCATEDPYILQSRALEGKKVHLFDCFHATVSTDTLQLKFFVPLVFVQKKYRVTLVMVHRTNRLNNLNTVFSANLEDIQAPWTQYAFHQTSKMSSHLINTTPATQFGTVTSHVCDGHSFETKISLSEAALQALSTARLSTGKISSTEIKFHCNSVSLNLNLCYPINFGKLKTDLSISKRFLSVSGLRQPYSLEEERQCFVVNPDHRLSLVPANLSEQVIYSHGRMQLTKEESYFVDRMQPYRLPSGLSKVKLLLPVLFEYAKSSCFLYSVSFPGNVGCLLVINKILFDYQHKTPVLDLACCFVDDFDRSSILEKWENISSNMQTLSFDEDTQGALKEVLMYFSRRTNGTVNSAGDTSKYAVLQKCDINNFFTRCVVYFLLCDPDVKLYASGDPFGFSTVNFLPKVGGACCAFCDKHSFTTKKCARCKAVSYCNKQCQTKHWKSHKWECRPTTKQAPKS